MKEKYFLLILLLISLSIKIPLALSSLNGFGVDESLYLSTARQFVETGIYGIKTIFYNEKFLVPFFPIVLSLFYFFGGESAAMLVSPLFSSILLIIIYYIGKIIFNKKVGIFSSCFVLFNPAIFVLGVRPLSETLALFLFSLSILFIVLISKNKKYCLLFLPCLFLTFITRYQMGTTLFFFSLVFLIFNKKVNCLKSKYFICGILLTLIIAVPWFLFNLHEYGNILGGPLHQSSEVGFDIKVASLYIPYFFLVVGFFFPFVFYGLYTNYKNKLSIFPLLGIVLAFLVSFILFGKTAEERYLISVLPFSALCFGSGLNKCVGNKLIKTFFALLLILNVVSCFYITGFYSSYPKYVETKQAALFLKNNCRGPVMGNSFTQVWYYTKFENIPYSTNLTRDINLIRKYEVDCVIVNLYEAPFKKVDLGDSFKSVYNTSNIFVYKKV